MNIMNLVERVAPTFVADMREQERSAISHNFEEAMMGVLMSNESGLGYSAGDARLAMEDVGWRRQGGASRIAGEQTQDGRRAVINKSRVYALFDSHAIGALRIWNNYTLGTGMTFKSEDTGLQTTLENFWNNRKNRHITSTEGQHKNNRRLLVDGEVFFAIIQDAAEDGVPLIRRIDAAEVTDIITDPQDAEVRLLYRREFMNGTTPTVMYYRDWAFDDGDTTQLLDPVSKKLIPASAIQEGVVVYPVLFNSMFHRGNSLLTGALPWCSNLRQFMEDRAAITSGLAKFIRKLTIKGGKAQLDKAMGAVKSAIGMTRQGDGAPHDLTRKAAQTFMANDNVSMDDMPRTTGAGDARQDFRNCRLMVCAALGVAEHYFGDGDSGNLATATAMELPMLKQFQTHQTMWADAWRDIFSIVASFEAPEPVVVDIDFPPIILDNVLQWAQAMSAVTTAMPELKIPELQREALTQLGVNNVDEVMEAVAALAKKNEDLAAKALAASQPGAPGAPGQKPTNDVNKLAEAIIAMTAQWNEEV